MTKNLFFLLTAIFCLCSFISFSQSPYIQWQRCIGGSNNDYLNYMDKTRDSGFILCGYTLSDDGDFAACPDNSGYDWAMKLDKNGKLEWTKILGVSRRYSLKIHQTADGGYIIASQNRVIKTDDKGTIKYSLPFTLFALYDVRQTIDGNYILCGDTEIGSTTIPYILKFDSAGSTIWKSIYGFGNFADCLDETNDGRYVYGGNYSDDGSIGIYQVLYDTAATFRYAAGGFANCWNVTDIKVTRQNAFVASGYMKHKGYSLSKWNIVYDDSTTWEVSDTTTLYPGNITCINNKILLSGEGGTPTFTPRGDAVYCQYDTNGRKQIFHKFGGSGEDNSVVILPTYDGGYLMAGNTSSNDGDVSGNHGGNDGWLVKLSGSITAVPQIPAANTVVKVYPTCTHGLVNVILPPGAVATIYITNMAGQSIACYTQSTTEKTIDLSHQPSGLYIVNIQADGTKQSYKIIKQ